MSQNYRSVLITGASSGMGLDFARRLLKDGMKVYAAARNIDAMKELEDAGAVVIAMDITREADVVAAAERILADGGVDVLINNAGYGQYGAVEDTPLEKARYQFEVNLFGLARLTQLLLPAMREKRRGLIINISSVGGRIYTPLGAWYHATKHALEAWSDALRLELAPHGIDVAIIRPGMIRTGFGDAMNARFAVAGNSAYADLADKLKKATVRTYENGGSNPSVITDLVVRAISARRPRTRYVGGEMARPLIFLRGLLPDRLFDLVLMKGVS